MCVTHTVSGVRRNFVLSSVKKELEFNLEYALNQMEIIKESILISIPEIILPENIGILNYEHINQLALKEKKCVKLNQFSF